MLQPEPQGELLTRVTIWTSLLLYVTSLVVFYLSRNRKNWDATARFLWTTACAALVIHVACAYHFYHAWSHASAYVETEVQTAQVYGVHWGGGVYINYVLMIGWIADVVWWWRGLDSYRDRRQAITVAWHAFLFFIFFNATVVFEGGILRWLGILFTIVALCALVYRKRTNIRTGRRAAGGTSL